MKFHKGLYFLKNKRYQIAPMKGKILPIFHREIGMTAGQMPIEMQIVCAPAKKHLACNKINFLTTN